MFGNVRDAEGLSRPSTMTLENNQYKNVVIAVHESVPEDMSLIDTLKVGFIYQMTLLVFNVI